MYKVINTYKSQDLDKLLEWAKIELRKGREIRISESKSFKYYILEIFEEV